MPSHVFGHGIQISIDLLISRVSALAFLAQRPLEESAGLGDTQIVKVNGARVGNLFPSLYCNVGTCSKCRL